METGEYEVLGIVKFNCSIGGRDLDVDGRKFFNIESFKYGKPIGISHTHTHLYIYTYIHHMYIW